MLPKLNGFEAGCDVAPNTGAAAGLAARGFEVAAEEVDGAAAKLKEKDGLLCSWALLAVLGAAPPAAAPKALGAPDCVEEAPLEPNAEAPVEPNAEVPVEPNAEVPADPNADVPPLTPNEKADFGAAAPDGVVVVVVFPPNALVLAWLAAGAAANALKPAGLLGVVVDMLVAADELPNALEAAGVLDGGGAPKPKAAGVLTFAGADVAA